MNSSDHVPIEAFINAMTTQLDRAQTAMAMKARNSKLPLTFAVKDISIDLRTHVEMVHNQVRIRPAGPGETDASMLRLSLTTITAPMIEENAPKTLGDPDEPSLKEALGSELTDEEQQRLEWVGVHNVSQLRQLEQETSPAAIQRVAQLPVERLRAALMRAAEPRVTHVFSEPARGSYGGAPAELPLLRIRGQNLMQTGAPAVRIGGENVQIVHASERELLLRPLAHQLSGSLEVEPEPGRVAQTSFNTSTPKPATPTPAPAPAPAPKPEGAA